MAVQPDTTTGTITITSGSASFTTSGTNMLTRGHQAGDTVHRNGYVLVIATISGENAGTFTENAPAAMDGSGVAVRIRFQPDGSRVAAQARNLIDQVSTLVSRLPEADASNPSKIYLYEATPNGTNKGTIAAPAALSADRTWTFPDADLTISSFIATLLDDADAATARSTIGAVNKAGDTLSGDLAISASGNHSVSITVSGASDIPYINLANATRSWQIRTDGAAGNFSIRDNTGVAERLNITSAGLVNLLAGQIAFPASQNASAGANTLDDYEEGTWSPGFAFGGGSTGMTFSQQTGSYTKLARSVEVNLFPALTAKGSSTGAATITGLPFTATAYGGLALGIAHNFAAGLTGGIVLYPIASSATVGMEQELSTTGTAGITHAEFGGTASITAGGHFQAAT